MKEHDEAEVASVIATQHASVHVTTDISAVATPVDVSSRRRKARKKAKAAPATEESPYLSCLQQAEICCEQARDAARLKRIEAACGLFSTAQSLLKRAVEIGGEACVEARERLASITTEMSAYCELSRTQRASQHNLKNAPQPVRVPVYSPPSNYRR